MRQDANRLTYTPAEEAMRRVELARLKDNIRKSILVIEDLLDARSPETRARELLVELKEGET